MTVIIGTLELIRDELSREKPAKAEIEIVVQQCYKMDEIIKKMISVTRYKTKDYTDGTEIFDLHGQKEELGDKNKNI